MGNTYGFDLPSFKEIHGSYEDYLLRKLNNGEVLSSDVFDAERVTGGFLRSSLFFLHDGVFKKTIVTAFHIPDKQGKSHHFDIHFFRFSRKKKADKWRKITTKELRDEEVSKLCSFLDQHNKLIGKKIRKQYYRILSSDSPTTLQDVDFAIDLLLKNQQINFEQLKPDDISKILTLIQKIVLGENIIIEKSLYKQLLAARTSNKSLKNYRDDLTSFKDLIKKSSTSETNMQNFLEERVWFFGLNYIQCYRRSRPKFNTSLGSEYDFLLEGFNQVYDIVELKGPNDPLFVEKKVGKRKRAMDDRIDYMFSAKFGRALHQILSYMHEFEERFEHVKENQPSLKNFLYPSGTIVMSKGSLFPSQGKSSMKYLHLINRQFSNITVLNYDDLADRAQITIDFINSIKTV